MADYQFMELSKKAKDLTGMTIGQLTVLGPLRSGNRSIIWLCRCSCGTEKEFIGVNLKSGTTHSCGCYRRAKHRTHGMKGTTEYNVWKTIRQRCNNPKSAGYKNYGGRGITLDSRWNRFENFIADMGKRPNPKLTIERIDNDGPYSPKNCKWATRKIQSNNSRQNHLISHNGETHTMMEWSEITGVSYTVLRKRINCLNWSVEDALSKPVDPRFRRTGEKHNSPA